MNGSVKVNLVEPTELQGDVTAHKMKKYKKDLAQCHEKSDECAECKAKVFLAVKGQCNLSVKTS